MRPYLVLTAVGLMAVAAFGQQPFPHPGYGPCIYGCGPYIPLITTPEISLQTVSPNPVGASNATTGLIAGATNSTLSQIDGSTSSEYTEAVWYEGGAPLTTAAVHLSPEQVGREGHIMREPVRETRPPQERAREERPRENRMVEDRMRKDKDKDRLREERAAGEQAPAGWTYFTGRDNATDSTSVVRGFKKAARVYTNDDVTRQNDKNGVVKYDSKTEKL
jgi:hypothetical protein